MKADPTCSITLRASISAAEYEYREGCPFLGRSSAQGSAFLSNSTKRRLSAAYLRIQFGGLAPRAADCSYVYGTDTTRFDSIEVKVRGKSPIQFELNNYYRVWTIVWQPPAHRCLWQCIRVHCTSTRTNLHAMAGQNQSVLGGGRASAAGSKQRCVSPHGATVLI